MGIFDRKKHQPWTVDDSFTVENQRLIDLGKLQTAGEKDARVKVRVFPKDELAVSEQMSFKHSIAFDGQPYSHMLYFGGEAAFTSKQYLARLLNSLESSRQTTPARAVESALINPTLNGVFVTPRFMERSSEQSHSLASRDLVTGELRDAESTVRKTVEKAHEVGAPMDFSYKAEDQPLGIRRANVVKLYHDYFIGEHHRGQRRYRYDRVIEAQLDGTAARNVVHEPAATITFYRDGAGLARLTFGDAQSFSSSDAARLKNLRLQRQELDQRIKELELKRAKVKA